MELWNICFFSFLDFIILRYWVGEQSKLSWKMLQVQLNLIECLHPIKQKGLTVTYLEGACLVDILVLR